MNVIFLISAVCLQAASAAVRLTMPVVLTDTENTLHGVISFPTNPFHKMTATSFSDVIRTATYRSDRIIIFLEDQFSMEDITRKDTNGTSYQHLHQGILDRTVKFIPNVYEPSKVLTQMFPPLNTNVFNVGDDKTTFDSNFKYYYVYFQDSSSNETRVQKLRRHDKIMKRVFFTVRQLSPGPVVAFYTGKANPIASVETESHFANESMPESAEQEPAESVMIVTNAALFWLSGIYSTVPPASYGGARRSMQAAPALTEQMSSARRMSTRMLYSDFELEFGFSYRTDGWQLDAVFLLEGGEEVGRTTMGVGAPWDWSYYCAEPICIFNTRDKSAVIIEKYQLEPLKSDYMAHLRHDPETSADDAAQSTNGTPASRSKDADIQIRTSFSRTLNCGPYFSSNILACLMVVAFLLSILAYGVTSLMNCQTNSTYDDMNQKPLVIVAQL